MKKVCGIYKIINLLNNQIYIGSSVNIYGRFSQHKWQLRKNNHGNLHLQRAWNKYGENNFKFKILEKTKSKENLLEKEQFYINFFKPHYNICKIAGSNSGVIRTEEWKKRIGNSNKGKPASENCKKAVRKANYGRKHNEEAKKKIGKAAKGRKMSKKHLKKLIEISKNRIYTNEIRQNMSNASTVKKAILQYSLDGKFIKKWDSISQAAKEYNTTKNNIISCLKNKNNRTVAVGYKWEYEN